MELLSRHSEGVIALTGCLQSRFCRRIVEDRPDDARAHIDDLIGASAPSRSTSRCSATASPEQDKANEGIVKVARELGRPLVATADVHYLRREDYDNHAALLCVQTKSTIERAEAELRHQRVLPEEPRGDGRSTSRSGPRRSPNTLEIAERCERRDGARQAAAAALRDPRRRRAGGDAAAARHRGAAPAATATRSRPRRRERLEFELGVISEMGFESYFLIVWDFVKYAKENGIAVGPGPRLGGRLDRRLRARDHRHRPARQRPALRALPQPRPQVDAGHRHRLLGPRPRARDPLRPGEVRARVRRADHHLRQDGPARGDPRRRPRARATTTRPATGSRSRSPSRSWAAARASRSA